MKRPDPGVLAMHDDDAPLASIKTGAFNEIHVGESAGPRIGRRRVAPVAAPRPA
jgi:hypothetical protein